MATQRASTNGVSLLDLQGGQTQIPHARRIFVNRNLKMASVRAIGFDMDHTLAVYRKLPTETLAFTATRDKLIAEKGYPAGIAALRYDPHLIIRGLVVDKRRGNILKTDQYSYVVRLYHGTRLVPKEERRRLYRNRRIRLSSPKYMSIDTLFALPEATLFAQLVDYFEADAKRPRPDFMQMYADVRECIDRAHADGTIKRAIVADLGHYIERHPQLPATLTMFRDHGKKLFLLTNSEPHYTEKVMSYLLDGAVAGLPRWTDYFAAVVMSAGKPSFFRSFKRPRRLRRDEMRAAALAPPRRGTPMLLGGGARGLEGVLGHAGEEILYVGDHTFGDILRAKAHSRWRTAMVIEELEPEIERERRLTAHYERLDALVLERDRVLAEIGQLQRRLRALRRGGTAKRRTTPGSGSVVDAAQRLEAKVRQLESESTRLSAALRAQREAIERRFNKHWGKLFKCGEINSRFGHQVKDFACIYTSAVRNFLAYPESMYFRSPREIMPHETGQDRD